MPPKRPVMQYSSSSDDSSSGDEAPREFSMASAKVNLLEKQKIQDEALEQLEQQRAVKAEAARLEKEKKQKRNALQEKKRQAAIAKAHATREEDEEEDDDEDMKFVQLASAPTSVKFGDNGDFGFSAEDLLAAAAVQKGRKTQKELFEINEAEVAHQATEDALKEKLAQQRRIAELLKQNDVADTSVFSDKTKKKGRFQVVSTHHTSTRAGVGGQKPPSAKDLLAMAHGFTAGVREQYHSHQLQHVPRIHHAADSRFSRGGVSQSLLDRGHTTKQKLAKNQRKR